MVKKYITRNTNWSKEVKNEFEKGLFKLMNNSVFGKTMENLKKHRDIKLVTADEKRNNLISKPNYHTTESFSEYLLATERKKTKVKMNKPVYIGMPILDISKMLMYEFWYDYIKPKYENRAKLCYTDTDSFIIHILTEDLFEDIADDVKKRLDTSNYDKNNKRLLQIDVNKKLLGFFQEELGGKMIKEICALGPKLYAFSMDDGSQHKKARNKKTSQHFKVGSTLFQHCGSTLK